MMKWCGGCKKQKPLFEFGKDNTKDGLDYHCKKCRNDYARKYQQTHKIEKAEFDKKYYQVHKSEKSEYNKKHRQINKVKYDEYNKKYRQTFAGCLRNRFAAIKQRCNNPKAVGYKNYGGRGIKCLFESSNEFIDYIIDTLGYNTYEKIKGLWVDRIDNNGHYERGNIRFVTCTENLKNRKR